LREQGIDALSVYDVHQQGWTDAALLAYAASVPVLVRPANHPSPLEGEGRVRGNHCHQTKKPGIVGQVSRLGGEWECRRGPQKLSLRKQGV